MKQFVVIAALVTLLFAPAAFSQEKVSSDSMIEMLRSDIRTEKRTLIDKALKFTDKQAAAFWPFYREYELEAGKIGDMRIAGLKDYAANYDKITDDKAKELVEKTLKYQEDRIDLMGSYYKKQSESGDWITKAGERTLGLRFVTPENAAKLKVANIFE